MYYTYSDSFAHTITSTYGTRGTQWLAQLPQIIEQCAARWQLTELKPYPNLTYNYVLSGMMGNKPVVLKLRCDQGETLREAAAISMFAWHGCMPVYSYDARLSVPMEYDLVKSGALLIERAIPGTSLTNLFPHNDAQATAIAANLIRKLHQASIPTDYTFPSLEQVLPQFTEEPRALAPFMPHARALRHQLLATQTKPVLLHGDFHQSNILFSDIYDWRVIDPEGIIGDPIYDLAVYIRNSLTELIELPNAKIFIEDRINDFAKLLGYDAQRIYDWTYLQAVTSAYWSIEDGLDASRHVVFLKLLKEMHALTF